MDIPHFIYSFIYWWTFGWYPLFGFFELCCYEHSCTTFLWTYVFIFLWYISRSGILGSYGLLEGSKCGASRLMVCIMSSQPWCVIIHRVLPTKGSAFGIQSFHWDSITYFPHGNMSFAPPEVRLIPIVSISSKGCNWYGVAQSPCHKSHC